MFALFGTVHDFLASDQKFRGYIIVVHVSRSLICEPVLIIVFKKTVPIFENYSNLIISENLKIDLIKLIS